MKKNMKIKTIVGLLALGLLAGASGTLLAQNGPGPRGRGYGGPPKSEQDRAERQANCPWAKDGQRPGIRARARDGSGLGQAQGKMHRRGLRDGTGPRAQSGDCPYAGRAPAERQR